MRSMRLAVLIAAILLSFAAPTVLAEEVENPTYLNWAVFKPGDSVTYKVNVKKDGQSMDMDVTTTLVEVTNDSVTVSRSISFRVAGQPKSDPMESKEVIPRRIEDTLLDPTVVAVADPKSKTGKETLKIGGRKLECTWHEVNVEQVDKTTKGKVWTSDIVPGSVVKLSIDSTQQGKIEMQAVSYKTSG